MVNPEVERWGEVAQPYIDVRSDPRIVAVSRMDTDPFWVGDESMKGDAIRVVRGWNISNET